MIKIWIEGACVTIGTVSTCFSRKKPAEWAPSDPSMQLHWSVSSRDCRPSKGLSWSEMMDTALSSIFFWDIATSVMYRASTCAYRQHWFTLHKIIVLVCQSDRWLWHFSTIVENSVKENIWLILLLTARGFKLKLQWRKREELILLHKKKFYFLTLWITKKGKKSFHFKNWE